MDGFDLDRLTDHDFELVCKDIFEELLGVRLEVFAPGADGGIDLRYLAQDERDPTIVQCKHWSKTGRPKFLKHYKVTEAAKVKSLAPGRYMVATSVPMTPSAKDALYEHLSPFLKTTGDVLGREELVALLRDHPEIVKRHLRLWLTSAAVLDTLLSKTIHQRANFFEQDVAETLKTYAPTPAFNDASTILHDHHVLVVAGIPGIGKTTLAHVIAAAYRADGYEIYQIANNIDDVLQVWDDDVPQLFYYDDFLGQTSLRDTVATSEDSRLMQLINRVSRSANKKLLLTTREYILAQARHESEKITKSRELALGKFVLDISRYSLAAKAEILYNHLHFSRLPRSHVAAFADPDAYRPIIEHENFNPRLVAMTFENAMQPDATPEESVARLMANLRDPAELWAHMVDNQMTPAEVSLIFTIYTLRGPVDFETLVDVWASATGASVDVAARAVKRSLATLEGTLIRVFEPRPRSSSPIVELHNPSIRDFLRSRLSEDVFLVRGVLQGVQQFEQVATLLLVATGFEGERLRGHLIHEREMIERVFDQTMPAELDGLDGRRWFGALWKGIKLGLTIGSTSILRQCEATLNEEWPDYADDPEDVVALIKTLREAPDRSALRAHEKAVTEWLIEDLLQDTSNWTALQSAAGHLSDLGGASVSSALDSIEEYLSDIAQEAAEDFADHGRKPGLSEAQEMVEQLDQFSNAEGEFHGFSALRHYVDKATEGLRDRQRDHGYTPNIAEQQSTAGIVEMMGHLRDQTSA